MPQMVKNLPAMQETQARSLGQEDPWRKEWLPTPVFLPGEGASGLYSPWGSQRVGQDQATTPFYFHTVIK